METTPTKKTKKTIIKRPSNEELKRTTENEEARKKLTVKTMVHEALADLKSRKGTSLYAIKKYMHANYHVDVPKVNYIIKKVIKTEVETGIIVQVNGVGATGSFKLAPTADKQKIKKVDKKNAEKKEDKKEKTKTTKSDTKAKKNDKIVTNVAEVKKKETVKRKQETEENKKEKTVRIKTTKESKMKKVQTPSKKKATMSKRKSIGSIIKPPKMKPRV